MLRLLSTTPGACLRIGKKHGACCEQWTGSHMVAVRYGYTFSRTHTGGKEYKFSAYTTTQRSSGFGQEHLPIKWIVIGALGGESAPNF
ncbi:hypothetical protein GDO78_020167 [Eleutherodactylus coqui]|uniref:Uncharacterized protein n=1 Tax=Eleutherodactylus coqui TaxID=57060 RepID=A0A8J6BG17_ELECQ|nr:hypothetical protein GDO78_020167 [Eleutherodactylus coqui]